MKRVSWQWLFLALAAAVVLVRLRDFLPPATLPLRGAPGLPFQGSDLTPQFAVFARVSIHALWEEGVMSWWSPLVNSGSPLFASATAGPLSLATLLGGLVQAEAAIKWAMLLHVLVGMWGVCILARELRVPSAFGATGALAFGLAPFLLDHFRVGHLCIVYPMPLVPWVLLCFVRALRPEQPAHRWAMAAGALLALQLLEGADSPLIYQGLAMPLVLAGAIFGPERGRFLFRALVIGALAGSTALMMGAFQLIPIISYMSVANRGGGMSLLTGQGGLPIEASMARISEVTEPVPGALYFACCALGFAVLVKQRDTRRTALWLALIFALGFGIAYSRSLYAFLWHALPGFRYQRIPQRALILPASVGPILVAAGAWALWQWLRRFGRAGHLAVVVVLLLFAVEMWKLAPPSPPMGSPALEMASNHALQWVLRHNDGSRMHVFETSDRHWGTEHVTVPLGLPVILGWTPSEHMDYIHSDFSPRVRTFVGESLAEPAKFWGMLNVRYVLSTIPRKVPGLHLAAQVPRCPIEICQPAKSAGPYIYENERWLPHAYRVKHAVAIVGPDREAFEAALDIMKMPAFDPSRLVVLQNPSRDMLAQVDTAVGIGPGTETLPQWSSTAGREAVRRAIELSLGAPPPVPARFERKNANEMRIGADGNGWLVVSERLRLFDGWKAALDSSEVPIIRANGVLSALAVPDGVDVDLRYRPPGLRVGLVLLCITAGVFLALELKVARERSRRL